MTSAAPVDVDAVQPNESAGNAEEVLPPGYEWNDEYDTTLKIVVRRAVPKAMFLSPAKPPTAKPERKKRARKTNKDTAQEERGDDAAGEEEEEQRRTSSSSKRSKGTKRTHVQREVVEEDAVCGLGLGKWAHTVIPWDLLNRLWAV
jgi:hypothetical protein